MARGIRFFPTRDVLEQSQNYNQFLSTAINIYGIFVTGRKLWINHIENAKNFHTIILPDPRSRSFIDYAESVDEFPQLQAIICRSTKKLSELYKIDVLWYPEMLHNSIMIGDPEKKSGWVHSELVLPHTKANMRPSITMYRDRHEAVVGDIWAAFNAMRGRSTQPDQEFIRQMLEGPG